MPAGSPIEKTSGRNAVTHADNERQWFCNSGRSRGHNGGGGGGGGGG
jgi:hypothetical protein